jgi:PKD repeat protein
MRFYLIFISFSIIVYSSCKKEEELEQYEIKIEASNNIPPPIKADFEVFINMDSGKYVHFINKSKNFTKVTWHFGDNTTSNEINPTHFFSNGNNKTVKLVVENKQNQKDSISIPISYRWFEYRIDCEYFLTDIKNKGYTIYNIKMYGGDGKFYFSLGDKPTTTPTQFIDSFFYKTYTTDQSYFYKYYSENNITMYKRYITLDLKDFYSLAFDLGMPINFNERTYKNGLSDPEILNDTLLTLKYNNGLLELTDTTLGHSFRGYLCSKSVSNTYVFSMPNKENTSRIETEEITFVKNNKNVNARREWNGWMEQYTTTIDYFGKRQ